ncbi:MAG TPA: hypothetical protein VGH74_17415 [Planctomycetaceae bacterium]|jgi:hypothetical protein
MNQLLVEELKTFEDKKAELLSTAEGKFVLIHGGSVLGTYNDEQDAINEGYKAVGNVPFLVRRIVEVEIPANFVNNNIGF